MNECLYKRMEVGFMSSLNTDKQIGKKGISPLVAAVLLIAVTMTIAGLLAYWAASYVRTTLPEQNETETECRLADFIIDSCTYDNSTSTLSLTLRNTKNVELKGLKAFLYYQNETISDPIDLGDTLPAGGMLKSFTVQGVNEDFSRIAVGTHCPELIREKSCTRA